jgi:HPt (histidine-containing phosphotransfer) domain-containing protein
MNIKELKSYLNCDDAFLISLMQKFIDEVAEITTIIKTAASNEDWKTVKTQAHKMLSSVRIFEMQEIIAVLEKLEIDADAAKNPDAIKKGVEQLLSLAAQTIYDITNSLGEIKAVK